MAVSIELSPARPVSVCGAGSMGAGIAQVASQAGERVIVFDISSESLRHGRDALERLLKKRVSSGKLTQADMVQILGRISWTTELADLRSAGLVIEAIVERLDVKIDLFKSIEGIVDASAVLATNTSSLCVTEIASSLRNPDRLIGLHFFNPAPVMKLVEIVRTERSTEALLLQAATLMRDWGKVPVTVADMPGFIVNCVARPFYAEGWQAFEQGVATAAQLDHAQRSVGGFRLGPLELGDLIGHDINYKSSESVFEGYNGRARFYPSIKQSRLVSAGKLGRKSGAGVYSYGDQPTAQLPEFIPGKAGDVAFLEDVMAAPVGVLIEAENYVVGRASGPSASTLSEQTGRPVVLIDHGASRFGADTPVVVMASHESVREAFEAHCHLPIIYIKDRAGAFVFRTFCQLANSAADLVMARTATAKDIDQAMLFGVNYPVGPIEWARAIGFKTVLKALEVIAKETGDPIYAPSPQLRVWARGGES